MVKHKRCGYSGAIMTCNHAGTCKYDGVAEAEYNWLHSILKETDHCTVKVRKIRAKTSKSMVFGANCKAEDLHCTLGHSMFVWDESVIHKCPFRRAIKQTRFEIVDGNSPGFKTSEFFFSFVKEVSHCDATLISTKEGVLLKFSDFINDAFYKGTGINETEKTKDLKEIIELTLGTIDRLEELQNEEEMDMFKRSCSNFETSLKLFSLTDKKTLRINDFNQVEWIFYSNGEGQIFIGDCYNVSYIKIMKKYKNCQDHLLVHYINSSNQIGIGKMDNNGVIIPRLKKDKLTKYCNDYPPRRYFSTGTNYSILLIKVLTHIIDTSNYHSIDFRFIKGIEDEMNHETILEEEFNEENFKEIKFDELNNNSIEVTNVLRKSVNKVINWSRSQTMITYILVISVIVGGIVAVSAALIACGINPCQVFWYCFSGCMKCTFDCLGKCLCFF